MLRRAMKRIKIPDKAIGLILSLFENRSSKIITATGLTEPVEMVDGIEQGEVLSPLLWRIFYDPLLVRVQESAELGYYISASEPRLGPRDHIQKKEIKVAVVAYADDTTWLAPNKQVMEKTLSIANEFFQINDIQINVKKSNLIVFNPKTKAEERIITFGGNLSPRRSRIV